MTSLLSSRYGANLRSYSGRTEYHKFIVNISTLSIKFESKRSLFCCRVNVLCIQTPVDDVEEQISQRKYDSGVRVDHVAVAHDEAEVVS